MMMMDNVQQVEAEKAKKRKRQKLVPGEKVEVRSFDEGLLGSWHSGVVIECGDGARKVQYNDLFFDDDSKRLIDSISVLPILDGITSVGRRKLMHRGFIRPFPPPLDFDRLFIHYGQCVDAYHDEAWWEGVIFDHNNASEVRTIFFPDIGDILPIEVDLLRITQDWDEFTQEWKPRGTWLFLKLIEQLEQENLLLVSVMQIWFEVREKKAFQILKEWTNSLKKGDILEKLVREIIDDHSKLAAKEYYGDVAKSMQPVDVEHRLKKPDAAVNDVLGTEVNTIQLASEKNIIPVDGFLSKTNLEEESKRLGSIRSKSVTNVEEFPGVLLINHDDSSWLQESISINDNSYPCISKRPAGEKMHDKCHFGGQNTCIIPEAELCRNSVYNSNTGGGRFDKISISNSETTHEETLSTVPVLMPCIAKAADECSKSKDLTVVCEQLPSNRTSKQKWEIVVLEAKFCPDSVVEYCKSSNSKVSRSILASDIRKHLAYLGWKVEISRKEKGIDMQRWRYTSRDGKSYMSLSTVCKDLNTSTDQGEKKEDCAPPSSDTPVSLLQPHDIVELDFFPKSNNALLGSSEHMKNTAWPRMVEPNDMEDKANNYLIASDSLMSRKEALEIFNSCSIACEANADGEVNNSAIAAIISEPSQNIEAGDKADGKFIDTESFPSCISTALPEVGQAQSTRLGEHCHEGINGIPSFTSNDDDAGLGVNDVPLVIEEKEIQMDVFLSKCIIEEEGTKLDISLPSSSNSGTHVEGFPGSRSIYHDKYIRFQGSNSVSDDFSPGISEIPSEKNGGQITGRHIDIFQEAEICPDSIYKSMLKGGSRTDSITPETGHEVPSILSCHPAAVDGFSRPEDINIVGNELPSKKRMKRKWEIAGTNLVPEAEYCPGSVVEYLRSTSMNSKASASSATNLRKHLAYLGWKLEICTTEGFPRWRYTSPDKKTYMSLPTVCKDLDTSTDQGEEKKGCATPSYALNSSSPPRDIVQPSNFPEAVKHYSSPPPRVTEDKNKNIAWPVNENFENVKDKRHGNLMASDWVTWTNKARSQVSWDTLPSGKSNNSVSTACDAGEVGHDIETALVLEPKQKMPEDGQGEGNRPPMAVDSPIWTDEAGKRVLLDTLACGGTNSSVTTACIIGGEINYGVGTVLVSESKQNINGNSENVQDEGKRNLITSDWSIWTSEAGKQVSLHTLPGGRTSNSIQTASRTIADGEVNNCVGTSLVLEPKQIIDANVEDVTDMGNRNLMAFDLSMWTNETGKQVSLLTSPSGKTVSTACEVPIDGEVNNGVGTALVSEPKQSVICNSTDVQYKGNGHLKIFDWSMWTNEAGKQVSLHTLPSGRTSNSIQTASRTIEDGEVNNCVEISLVSEPKQIIDANVEDVTDMGNRNLMAFDLSMWTNETGKQVSLLASPSGKTVTTACKASIDGEVNNGVGTALVSEPRQSVVCNSTDVQYKGNGHLKIFDRSVWTNEAWKQVSWDTVPSGRANNADTTLCDVHADGDVNNGFETALVSEPKQKINGDDAIGNLIAIRRSPSNLLMEHVEFDKEKSSAVGDHHNERTYGVPPVTWNSLVHMKGQETSSSEKKKEELALLASGKVGGNVGEGYCNERSVRQLDSSFSFHGSRPNFSMLIDNDVVSPLAKVYYCSKSGDRKKEGHITREGIKCDCCQDSFGVSGFEVHAGSTYRRPAANIFLEDGRSLKDCQLELGCHDNLNIMLTTPPQPKCKRDNIKNITPPPLTKHDRDNLKDIATPSPQRKRGRGLRKNDHVCSVCHLEGQLTFCNHCPSSFHRECLGLKVIPKGEWFCSSCCCGICGKHKFNNGARQIMDGSVVNCFQCERRYHVGCLLKQGDTNIDKIGKEKWFCKRKCEQIYLGLGKLLGKRVLVGDDNLIWTLLKCTSNNDDLDDDRMDRVETLSNLKLAVSVMHECFEPVKEPQTKIDILDDVIFSRGSKVNRLNFQGFYTVLLLRDDELISVAAVRVFGEKVAEVPVVGTRFLHRRHGMGSLLMNVLEKKLMELGVERLVVPVTPSVSTWTSFGFSKTSESERLNLLNYTFLDFQGTAIMYHKILNKSAPPINFCAGSRQNFNDSVAGSDNADVNKDIVASGVVQAEPTEVQIMYQGTTNALVSGVNGGNRTSPLILRV